METVYWILIVACSVAIIAAIVFYVIAKNKDDKLEENVSGSEIEEAEDEEIQRAEFKE